ncbi:MAG: SPASM domain-containing protein, partial [Candidatus Micrarchaeia archaeon]
DLLISLNASNNKLYRLLVGRDYFDLIIEQLKYLVKLQHSFANNLHLALKFLITSLNIEDLPNFVKLASNIGINYIYCHYITIYKPEHLKLSCFFEKDKTNKIFDQTEKLASQLGINIVLPPRFNTKYTNKKIMCSDPWKFFYVEVQGSVVPCCFAGGHAGYITKEDFFSIWNGDVYKKLREGLINNNPQLWCKNCYKYDPENVNKIESHITFRPETKKEILNYIKHHKEEFPVFEEIAKL